MKAASGALRALCLLAASGTMTFELPAAPLVTGSGVEERHAPLPAEDGWQHDRGESEGDRWSPSQGTRRVDGSAFGRPSPVGPFPELTPGAAAALLPGDAADALVQRNSVLIDLMRDFSSPTTNPAAAGAAGSGSGRANPAQVAAWETFDSVLKMVRDSIMDDNDTANFSLVGLEFSVTQRGDRRSLTLNGQDLLPASLNGTQGDEGWRSPAYAQSAYANGMPAAIAQGTAGQGNYGGAMPPAFSLAKIRDFITHPLALMAALVAVGLWVFLRVFRSARDRLRW